jgi:very-short-patch-repair endonuclease
MPAVQHTVERGRSRNDNGERARQLRRAQTPAESRLWAVLRREWQGSHFRRQQVVEGFIVDFYCHEAALVVELDGAIHRQQSDEDAHRDAVLMGWGYTVIRLTNEDVTDHLPDALARIRQAIRSASDTCS